MRLFPSLCRLSRSAISGFRPVMEPLVVIYGSTGTGKSDLAVELATRFNGEIINADAMQMYEGLPIITNKITTEEQKGIPHHLLGNIGLDEETWTAAVFKREATKTIREIRSRGKLPIVVGGSSYYIDGLLFDDRLVAEDPFSHQHDDAANLSTTTREEVAARFPILSASGEEMLKKLREVDPVMADRWHPNDARKIRTSLEIYLATGRRASDIYAEQAARKASKYTEQSHSSPWRAVLFWLYAKPELLNERLDKRVDKMVANGLLDETSEVYNYLQQQLAAGQTMDRTKGIWQSIGFKQFEPYLSSLKSTDTTPESAELEKLKQQGIEDTKTATRRYAKYQVRWITTKTITSLQDEKVLDKFYLLDSSDLKSWDDEVSRKGTQLTQQFLDEQPLPKPMDISETAREVLAQTIAKSNKQDTPCNRTCDYCGTTVLTEELWQRHVNGRRHKKAVQYAKRTALVVVPDQQLQTVEIMALPDTEPS
ncbi:mitochondrial tRNA dimethylallyltransferase [Diplogelasinospora grovesii]|uniref:tRNA dimethylallyltransferase n=1 Tax=Diplogelasinospora grovesii TaxID=303347 RepID=A0AAN6S9T8_9PEZI|nr:mitochondrial tRNA dimethylallyltransferase [Diplogelasinospora grovesii]